MDGDSVLQKRRNRKHAGAKQSVKNQPEENQPEENQPGEPLPEEGQSGNTLIEELQAFMRAVPVSSAAPESSLPDAVPFFDIEQLKALRLETVAQLRPVLAMLIEQQVNRFDPVRFHRIETMARHALTQNDTVARLVEGKALLWLSLYLADFCQEQEVIARLLAKRCEACPESAAQFLALFNTADFKALKRAWRALDGYGQCPSPSPSHSGDQGGHKKKRTLITDLIANLVAQLTIADADGDSPARWLDSRLAPLGTFEEKPAESAGELKSVRLFRESAQKQSMHNRVTQLISEGPENAGPLNPHRLMIRSLCALRDLSPDYLNRVISHIDTLLWLEQAGSQLSPIARDRK
jgi:hypothetical protein